MAAGIGRLPPRPEIGAIGSLMNKNSDGVTASDIAFLILCIVGFLTGLAGVMMAVAWAAILGLLALVTGFAYFGIVQAVDA